MPLYFAFASSSVARNIAKKPKEETESTSALNIKSSEVCPEAKPVAVPAVDYGHDLDGMAAAITDKTKMIFIANPNNPTGTFLTTESIKAFLGKVPQNVIVVLDEAYYEYVPEAERAPSVEWIKEYPNLVVSRTFSKAYGLAGLRAGYAVSHEGIADVLNRIRQPFNMNSLSLKAAEVVLDDHDN